MFNSAAFQGPPDRASELNVQTLKYFVDTATVHNVDANCERIDSFSTSIQISDWTRALAYTMAKLNPVEVDIRVLYDRLTGLGGLLHRQADVFATVVQQQYTENPPILRQETIAVSDKAILRAELVSALRILVGKSELRRRGQQQLEAWVVDAKERGIFPVDPPAVTT